MSARSAARDLPPAPTAAREARRFVEATCADWGVAGDVDTVTLLTSELVTNGVLHARTPITVVVHADDEVLTVEVHDHDPRPPIPRAQRIDLLADIDELVARQEHASTLLDERQATFAIGPAGAIGAGRGLILVESLADEWGVQQHADGKSVWFRVGAG